MTAPPDSDGQLGIVAGLAVTLGRLADQLDKQHENSKRKTRLYESLHQVPLGPAFIPISGGAGLLQVNDLFKAKTGYTWSVRRLSLSGFTAGTGTVFLNGQLSGGAVVGTPEPLAPFPQAGVFTFGRGEALMQSDDNLLFSVTGITLAAGFPGVLIGGAADMFETWLLPDYIM